MQMNRLRCFSHCLILAHFPLRGSYPQKWISRDDLKNKGYLTARKPGSGNKQVFIFYVGDYVASSWLSQTHQRIWDHPMRGKVPLMWSISPCWKNGTMAMEYRGKQQHRMIILLLR